MRHSTLLQKPGNNKQHKYVHIKCSNSNDIHTEMHHNLQADDMAIILMKGQWQTKQASVQFPPPAVDLMLITTSAAEQWDLLHSACSWQSISTRAFFNCLTGGACASPCNNNNNDRLTVFDPGQPG